MKVAFLVFAVFLKYSLVSGANFHFCAPPDNDILGDFFISLNGDESYYDNDTDEVILFIYTPDRYKLLGTSFKGQADSSVEYPDGENSSITVEVDEPICMQTIQANIPLSSFVWANLETYFSTGRRAFYVVTMYITLTETFTVQKIDATRTLELPISFFLYLSTRTELFPEFIKTTVDEAFEYYINTKVAVQKAHVDGTSMVEIEFETGMNEPWKIVDFQLDDHWKYPNRIIPGSQNLTMISHECSGVNYKYEQSDGICIDNQGKTTSAMYTDITHDNDDVCETVCSMLDECVAYDVYPAYKVCEVIGQGVPFLITSGTWTGDETPGYEWVHFFDEGATPIGGDGSDVAKCYVKGTKSHFCTQNWRLSYKIDHVCGVDGRHNLTLIAGLPDDFRTQDVKYMSTDIWIFYEATCAKVIDYMTLVGDLNLYRTNEFLNPSLRHSVDSWIYGQLQITDRPLVGVTINSFKIEQFGTQFDGQDPLSGINFEVLHEVSNFDFRFFLPSSLFEGSIKGQPANMKLDITVQFAGLLHNSGTQRLLLEYKIPSVKKEEELKTALFSSDFFLTHIPCKNPVSAPGFAEKKHCPHSGKYSIRICTKNGWDVLTTCAEQNAISNIPLPFGVSYSFCLLFVVFFYILTKMEFMKINLKKLLKNLTKLTKTKP